MSMSFKLDKNSAIQGSGGSSRIDETGAYVGKFTQAYEFETSKGSRGIEMSFESETGQTARVTIFTHGQDGKETFGIKQINAIMACLSLRELASEPGTITRYDFSSGSNIKETAETFPALCRKPIGLLLQKEHYTSSKGTDAFRINLTAPFHAETRCTAAEILENLPAVSLEKMIANLRDKDQRTKKAPSSSPAAASAGSDLDDDIPF